MAIASSSNCAMGSALLLRLRYRKNANATRPRTDIPPRMPPTILPVGALDVLPGTGLGAGPVVGLEIRLEFGVTSIVVEVGAETPLCVGEVDVEVTVADVVRNTDSLLGSLFKTAPARLFFGHTPSLLHGLDAQQPRKVDPLVHVYHNGC